MTLPPETRQLTEYYAKKGETLDGLAKIFNVGKATIRWRVRRWGIVVARASVDNADRDMAMVEQYKTGMTLAEVGELHGVTRERVRQVLVRCGLTKRDIRREKRIALIRPYVQQIMTAYLAGQNMQEIRRDLGIQLPQTLWPKPTALQHKNHRVARFWLKTQKQTDNHPDLDTPCWLWTGAQHDITGYGSYGWKGKNRTTHTLSYEITYGKPQQWVLHKCNVPLCVNPDHLYDGSAADNARDRSANGGRSRKFTQDEVADIKAKLAEGASVTEIAEAHKRCVSTIYHIRLGKSYTNARRKGAVTDEQALHVWSLKDKPIAEIKTLTGVKSTNIGRILKGRLNNDVTGALAYKASLRLAENLRIEAETAEIKEAIAGGEHLRSIAKRLHKSLATIYQRIKQKNTK